jgi:tetratricopeptide (TPR) repeat protein
MRGDIGRAESEYRRLLEEQEASANFIGLNGISNVCLLEGRFNEIPRVFTPFFEVVRKAAGKDAEYTIRSSLADIYLASGELGKALDECQKARAAAVTLDYLAYMRNLLYLEGRIYLEMKKAPEAEKAAEELRAVNARGMRKDIDIRIYDHLMGRIELAKKSYDKAIAYLKKAVDALPYGPLETDASFLDSLALAYFRAGDLAKAQTEYERITTLTTGRWNYGDIYAKSFYMLGRIFEQKGDAAKARSNYERFLGLWKDADPGQAEVNDARKRLAELGGH